MLVWFGIGAKNRFLAAILLFIAILFVRIGIILVGSFEACNNSSSRGQRVAKIINYVASVIRFEWYV